MNQAKYIGMDVHQATISVAVMDSAGKLILESILETKATTILQFIGGPLPRPDRCCPVSPQAGRLEVRQFVTGSNAWYSSDSRLPTSGFLIRLTVGRARAEASRARRRNK